MLPVAKIASAAFAAVYRIGNLLGIRLSSGTLSLPVEIFYGEAMAFVVVLKIRRIKLF